MGSTPGLFADPGDKPSCDTQTLIANLGGDPAKATAWATALGLQSKDIPAYVTSLTPVVLRSDTAVTSYGYADGRFFAYPAVLQAGTAVFINSFGEPKAKCFSGNPLTQPASIPNASYVGASWEQFAPKSITVIQRPPTVIINYILVDKKGATVHRPAKRQSTYDGNWHCKNNSHSHECGGMTTGKVSGKEKSGGNGKKSHEERSSTNGKTGEHKSGENKSGEHRSGENKSGENKSGENKSGENKSGENKSGENKSGENKSGENKSGEQRSGENKSGENKSGENKSGSG